MSDTLAYYAVNAARFFDDTVTVDMSALYTRFLARVPAGGLILDAGCGSGRDSKALLAAGYRVEAFDASPELARLASEYLGRAVAVRRCQEVNEQAKYDGIWACASLLHLREAEIPDALCRLCTALRPGGTLYLSFKLGEGERVHDGRHFTDATEARLRTWLADMATLDTIECWITPDQRPDRAEHWLNALVRCANMASRKLVTGGDANPFLPHLCAAITQADEIDLAVAFVKTTGLRLLLPDLHAALGTNGERARTPARLRVITSDYLDVTDPEALRLLMLLQELGAQVRVYEAAGSSFHMKAYICAHFKDGGGLHGTAFIGSSNISRQALKDGLEWNYRVDYPGDDGFLETRARFETLFRNPRTVALSDAWIDRYEARRTARPVAVAPGTDEFEAPPTPTPVQRRALEALTTSRVEGYQRGLVVLATGLGKTWLAAFAQERVSASTWGRLATATSTCCAPRCKR